MPQDRVGAVHRGRRVRAGPWTWRCVVAGLLASLTLPALAQFQPVQGQEYREVMHPKHPVSGHAVVGLSVIGGAPARRLQVYLPQAWKAPAGPVSLRVDLDTPDGRLHGTGLFSGSVRGSGWQEIQLLPDQAALQRPADLDSEELALAVRVMADGGRGTPQLLLAGWAQADLQQATLRLHINSRRASMQVQGRSGGERRACRKVKSSSSMRFDSVCELPVAELERLDDGRHQLRLLRRDGFSTETTIVPLWL